MIHKHMELTGKSMKAARRKEYILDLSPGFFKFHVS